MSNDTHGLRELLPVELPPAQQRAVEMMNALIDHCMAEGLAYCLAVATPQPVGVNMSGAVGVPDNRRLDVIENMLAGLRIHAEDQQIVGVPVPIRESFESAVERVVDALNHRCVEVARAATDISEESPARAELRQYAHASAMVRALA